MRCALQGGLAKRRSSTTAQIARLKPPTRHVVGGAALGGGQGGEGHEEEGWAHFDTGVFWLGVAREGARSEGISC